MTRPTPAVLAFVLGLSFVVLLVAFRSLVVALISIALNLLSVGAAYGLLTLVFLHGLGASLFGFEHVHAIDAWVPLFLFSVQFGLSMDYQGAQNAAAAQASSGSSCPAASSGSAARAHRPGSPTPAGDTHCDAWTTPQARPRRAQRQSHH